MVRAAPTSPAELRLPPDPRADTTESGCLAMAARVRGHLLPAVPAVVQAASVTWGLIRIGPDATR
jgi:hypothetical protein